VGYLKYMFKYVFPVGFWYCINEDEDQDEVEHSLSAEAGLSRKFFRDDFWNKRELSRAFQGDADHGLVFRNLGKRKHVATKLQWVRAMRLGTDSPTSPSDQIWPAGQPRRSIAFHQYRRLRRIIHTLVSHKKALEPYDANFQAQIGFMNIRDLRYQLGAVALRYPNPTRETQVTDNATTAIMNWLPPGVLQHLIYQYIAREEDDRKFSVASVLGGQPRTYLRLTQRRNEDVPLAPRSVRRRSQEVHQALEASGIDAARVLASVGRRDRERWRKAEVLLRRMALELTPEQTFQLWQRLAERGASAASFNELRAFLRHFAGRRVLLGSSADVRRREKASATRFDVKLLHLEDTLGNEKEVVVSLVASLKESIEEEIGALGLDFVLREIDGRDDLVTLVFMIDKGQGWTTAIMGYLNQKHPLSARSASIVGRFAEVPDSYENLRRAIFGPLGEALALIANDKVGVLRVVSAEPPFVGAAALVAHDVEESFVWPMDEALIALPSSLADVLVSSYAAVVVDEDDAAVGVITLVMKDTGADDPSVHHNFKPVAFTLFREKVPYPFQCCRHLVRLFQAGDNALLSTVFGHQGHSARKFSWANHGTLEDKKSRDDDTPVLTASSPDPRRRVLSEMIQNALYYIEGGRRADLYQSITKKPLTPIEPARTARIRV